MRTVTIARSSSLRALCLGTAALLFSVLIGSPSIGPAVAQEGTIEGLNRVEEFDLIIDVDSARAAGFTILKLPQRKHLQESKDIAEAFVRPMLPKPRDGMPEDPPNFGYAIRDIDGDGYGELFVMYRNAGFCGEDGCRLVGYRFDGREWKPFLDAYAMELGIKPPTGPGPFWDIALIGEQEKTRFLRWTGSAYTAYR